MKIEVISLVNLDDNVGNIRQLGGAENVHLAITAVIRKPEGTPLAIVSGDTTITMVYADIVHLKWTKFEGSPEYVENVIQERWKALADAIEVFDNRLTDIQGILFKDASDPMRMCLVAFPRPSIVDSLFNKPEA